MGSPDHDFQDVPKGDGHYEKRSDHSHPRTDAECSLDGHEDVKTERHRQRKQREGGERRGRRKDTLRVFPAFHDGVLHGKRYQQPDGDHDHDEASAGDQAQRNMQVDKNFLEHAVELESEQHLRAKDQEARLVEDVFKLSLQAHPLLRAFSPRPGFLRCVGFGPAAGRKRVGAAGLVSGVIPSFRDKRAANGYYPAIRARKHQKQGARELRSRFGR
jgi:hypothetical protein